MSKLSSQFEGPPSTSKLSFPYQLLESSSTLQYRIHRHIHGLRRESKSLQTRGKVVGSLEDGILGPRMRVISVVRWPHG